MAKDGTKRGTKKIPIDWDYVIDMLQKQASGEAIAQALGIDNLTLYRRCTEEHGMSFTDFKAKHRVTGLHKLRSKMFDTAINDGNVQLMIFLSKNVLGMAEKQEQVITVKEWSTSWGNTDENTNTGEDLYDSEPTDY